VEGHEICEILNEIHVKESGDDDNKKE